MELSLDLVFGFIALACLGFVFQMMLEFNRHKSEITPQLNQVKEIRERHQAELEKVAQFTQDAAEQVDKLDKEIIGLEEELATLEEKLVEEE